MNIRRAVNWTRLSKQLYDTEAVLESRCMHLLVPKAQYTYRGRDIARLKLRQRIKRMELPARRGSQHQHAGLSAPVKPRDQIILCTDSGIPAPRLGERLRSTTAEYQFVAGLRQPLDCPRTCQTYAALQPMTAPLRIRSSGFTSGAEPTTRPA